ncbi:MAG TPA: hypothetical protein VM536_15620, partial [Chloroflexia bacterium]|nr:hypothetical protein [Chloroflexia bacterium]
MAFFAGMLAGASMGLSIGAVAGLFMAGWLAIDQRRLADRRVPYLVAVHSTALVGFMALLWTPATLFAAHVSAVPALY